MALDLQADCIFGGPALPLPFVTLNLEAELTRLRLLPRSTGEDARAIEDFWPTYRAHLRQLVSQGGSVRVRNQVVNPLLACPLLGYTSVQSADEVQTREGRENGGAFLVAADGARLRFWTAALNEDLDAPARRGEAYRFSHSRIASRVLLASGERLGLLSNGAELRLIICDPARLDSHVTISLDGSWKRAREVPDSLRLFVALAKPEGVRALPELVEKARLQQAKVTKDLRSQARLAVEEFIQAVIDHEDNRVVLANFNDPAVLARKLWREGLITVYRLLFILKLESTDDPAKCFSVASGSLWRNSFSPGVALAPLARAVLDRGEHTGSMLEQGMRNLFRMLESGLQCTELNVKPMGGSLFAPHATPILSSLHWPEHGVAQLLDRLLWTTPRRGVASRERVYYGSLDVEDLGRVYEALLELDPGIASEPMCRLRRAKLEVVVPAAQGERYRPATPVASPADTDTEEEPEPEEEESSGRTRVEWIEEIPPGRFYLRVGLGRKSTGSFYTPHSFVRFLVQETLGPLVERVSPREDPRPSAILKLKVVDKAMGSGHFLVEACRFLGDALYEACRRCDDLARAATLRAEAERTAGNTEGAAQEESLATDFTRRIEMLRDPDDELLRYLPSRAVEGVESGFSQHKAVALCRRMVAVHCLYGVDRNPLAVELAKLALWIECHAEGLPLTFLDHRLVLGDSLTGPFFEHLLKFPGTQQPLTDLFTDGLTEKLSQCLANALQHVRDLEATVGSTVAETEAKIAAKSRLDRALAPFRLLAAAWSGGVMLGTEGCDDTAYASLARTVAETGDLPATLARDTESLRRMIATGLGRAEFAPCASMEDVIVQLDSPDCIPAFSYDLGFPEVFYPTGDANNRRGFDADVGNPPWDQVEVSEPEFWAQFNLEVLAAPSPAERLTYQESLASEQEKQMAWQAYLDHQVADVRIWDTLAQHQVAVVGGKRTSGKPDAYRLFFERSYWTTAEGGAVGLVLPSSFHAAEGATGIRDLCLNNMKLRCCFSFENKRGLFEIHKSIKYATVLADKVSGGSDAFTVAFYLIDDGWLFAESRRPLPLTYFRGGIVAAGGGYHVFPECRSQVDFDILATASDGSIPLGSLVEAMKVDLRQGMSVTREASKRLPLSSARISDGACVISETGDLAFPVHEGKTFTDYADRFDSPIREVVPLANLSERAHWRSSVRFFRLAQRLIASSTNQRTSIFAVLPPGYVCVHSARIEATPDERPDCAALWLCAVWNSFAFDFLSRIRVGSNVSEFIVNLIPMKVGSEAKCFLAHAALRLSANHAGYEPLWREQVGEAWREADAAWMWPALSSDDARWAVRAAVDAVVAAAYGLTREQYVHVLSSFSHTSFREAPQLCLAAFDDLQRDGIEAFTRRHDPYWDIPLNESLPRPVINLPVPAGATVQETPAAYGATGLFGNQAVESPRRGQRRRR